MIFFGSEASVFVTRTSYELRKRGHDIQILDLAASAKSIGVGGVVGKIARLVRRRNVLRQELRRIPRGGTAVLHSLSVDFFWLIPALSHHFDRVVGLAYGSDVLRRNKKADLLLRYGLRRVDVIAATNDNVLSALLRDFPFLANKDPRIIRFGLPVFDELEKIDGMSAARAKEILGYAPNRKLIALGYSASRGQRQIELIDFFAMRPDILAKYTLLVPVQYGDPAVVQSVKERCLAVNAQLDEPRFVALQDFHDPARAAVMRRATDVLINYSISDAFSGTVQETVYAGNVVLAGIHLPYGNMPGYGTAIKTFGRLDEAASNLQLKNLTQWQTQAAENRSRVRHDLRAICSWDAVYIDWYDLIGAKHDHG